MVPHTCHSFLASAYKGFSLNVQVEEGDLGDDGLCSIVRLLKEVWQVCGSSYANIIRGLYSVYSVAREASLHVAKCIYYKQF